MQVVPTEQYDRNMSRVVDIMMGEHKNWWQQALPPPSSCPRVVQPYAFTTKSLFVGHMDYRYLRWQV